MTDHPKLPSLPGTQREGAATYGTASVSATERKKKQEKIYHFRKIRNAGIFKASREKVAVRGGKDMSRKEARLCRKRVGG